MKDYLIKKLGSQELGYSNSLPGESRGQYFLISKRAQNFFPNVTDTVKNDTHILNIITHDSIVPALLRKTTIVCRYDRGCNY